MWVFGIPGTVVLNDERVFEVAQLVYIHYYVRQDSCLLACVCAVVNRFLNCSQQCLPLVIKTKEMPVFLEKFGYGYFPLTPGHFVGLLPSTAYFAAAI